jgi:hypothetical protein
LAEEVVNAVGLVDHHFVGRLERRFRRAGAEDLVVLLTNGKTVPGPASGTVLEENFSVSLAVEYRGHWVRMSRVNGEAEATTPALRATPPHEEGNIYVERLDGVYPYECGNGNIVSEQREYVQNGKRLFSGDTRL